MKVSIVIPVYNEERNISPLVEDLRKLSAEKKLACEIVIVDDNSSDDTGRISDDISAKYGNVTVIHRKKKNNGMGFALIDGTTKAKGEFIVWVMGDRSDNLDTIPEIVKKLRSGYDMVLGSRYMNGGSRGDLEIGKSVLGASYSFVSGIIFGMRLHDITNAFRGFRKRVFAGAGLQSGDFAISPEFTIKAHMKGYRIGEVPTGYYSRKAGKSNFKILRMGIRYVSLFRYGI